MVALLGSLTDDSVGYCFEMFGRCLHPCIAGRVSSQKWATHTFKSMIDEASCHEAVGIWEVQ